MIAGHAIVVGGEPPALSCAARLLQEGIEVTHIFPVPWGLLGAARDIGLAYPELGEPFERLAYALGEDLARELHAWGKQGVDLLTEHAKEWTDGVRRGSRLAVSRHEQDAQLAGNDALDRQRHGDEVRLMSGGAASNYAPLSTDIHQASFETHAVAFSPVPLCEYLQQGLAGQSGYHAVALSADQAWRSCSVESCPTGVKVSWKAESGAAASSAVSGDVVVVAAGYDTGRLLGKFSRVLVPLLGQAFRSQPLREKARSSVVGVTASWGHERYRFDADWCLLGCGINPGAGEFHREPTVIPEAQTAFWNRATSIFSDLAQSGEEEALRWAVLLITTCDGLPLLGPLPGEPRIQVAEGFSTSAWSRGYAAGEVLGQCLGGAAAPPLLQRCSPRRLL